MAVQVARGIERHQSAVFVGQALHATVTAPFCARCCGRDAIEGMFAGLRGGSVAKFTRFSSTFGRERKADLGLISQRRTLFAVPFQFAVCLGLAIAFNTIPRRAKGATDHIGPLLVKAGSEWIAEFAVFETDLNGLAVVGEPYAAMAALTHTANAAAWVISIATISFQSRYAFYAFVGAWITSESCIHVAFDGRRLAVRTILPFEVQDACCCASGTGADQMGVLVFGAKNGLTGITVFVFLCELRTNADRGKSVAFVTDASAFVSTIRVGRTNRSVVSAILQTPRFKAVYPNTYQSCPTAIFRGCATQRQTRFEKCAQAILGGSRVGFDGLFGFDSLFGFDGLFGLGFGFRIGFVGWDLKLWFFRKLRAIDTFGDKASVRSAETLDAIAISFAFGRMGASKRQQRQREGAEKNQKKTERKDAICMIRMGLTMVSH